LKVYSKQGLFVLIQHSCFSFAVTIITTVCVCRLQLTLPDSSIFSYSCVCVCVCVCLLVFHIHSHTICDLKQSPLLFSRLGLSCACLEEVTFRISMIIVIKLTIMLVTIALFQNLASCPTLITFITW